MIIDNNQLIAAIVRNTVKRQKKNALFSHIKTFCHCLDQILRVLSPVRRVAAAR